MTEETKKPRRKRRTKAQIEADKAAELATKEEERCIPCEESAAAALEAAEAALEKEEQEAAVSSEKVAKEEPAVSAKPTDTKKAEEPYVELTGLAKIRARVATRRLRDIR